MMTKPAKLSPLLTLAETAEHLKVDPRTVRRALKKGELHATMSVVGSVCLRTTLPHSLACGGGNGQ